MMWWLISQAHASTFTPVQATVIARQVDHIYAFLLIASLISFVILIGGMIYFVIKYKRRSANDKTAYITHNHTAEFLWSFIPFLIFMFVFAWGWIVYHDMRQMPQNALEVHVFAKKWDWRFVYKNGKEVTSGLDDQMRKVPATMVVPVGRPVKLIMASEKISPTGDANDRPVLHSFYVPAFRVKQDVVPGRYTTLWFQAEKKGTFHVFCTEYCGAGHSAMLAAINVVENNEFEAWLAGEQVQGEQLAGAAAGGANELVAKGRTLYAQKACIGCHSVDGAKMTGPTFKGLFGRTEKFTDGTSGVSDENYIRESILQPNAKTVAGYPAGAMPSYAGQLSEEDITAIIEFIKSLK